MAHPLGGGFQLSESESHPENVRSHGCRLSDILGDLQGAPPCSEKQNTKESLEDAGNSTNIPFI